MKFYKIGTLTNVETEDWRYQKLHNR